jgi:predicted nucleic acid-binding protein
VPSALVLDTSGLLAVLDADQRIHEPARKAFVGYDGPLLLSPFVLAELDYLLVARVSRDAGIAGLTEVARGAYRLEPFSTEDVAEAVSVIERYPDLGVGLADASVVVLANRYDTYDVLTLDERHFRVLRGPQDHPFRLLPADAA